MTEVKVLTAQYRQIYNQIRPHSSLGYRPPAPEMILWAGWLPALVLIAAIMLQGQVSSMSVTTRLGT